MIWPFLVHEPFFQVVLVVTPKDAFVQLCSIKLLTLKSNWVFFLHEDPSNGEVTRVDVNFK